MNSDIPPIGKVVKIGEESLDMRLEMYVYCIPVYLYIIYIYMCVCVVYLYMIQNTIQKKH